MALFKNQGFEFIYCCIKEDEDYKKGHVTLFFGEPTIDEDIIVFICCKQYLL
jgi:uncharacterized radical SAM superfamily Fe-S cluster-containing enzyme